MALHQLVVPHPVNTLAREKICGPVENLQHTLAYVRATGVPVPANDNEEEWYTQKQNVDLHQLVVLHHHVQLFGVGGGGWGGGGGLK